MTVSITATQVRQRWKQTLADVGREPVEITSGDRAVAVMMDPALAQRALDALDDAIDMTAAGTALAEVRDGQLTSTYPLAARWLHNGDDWSSGDDRYEAVLCLLAQEQLHKIPRPARERILAAVSLLASTPRPPTARALAGRSDVLRVRLGNYHVVYHLADPQLLVLTVTLHDRRHIYRP